MSIASHLGSAAKITAIAKDAHAQLALHHMVLVAAHFSDSLGPIQDALSSEGVTACLCATPLDLQQFIEAPPAGAPAVALALAWLLGPRSLPRAPRTPGRSFACFVAEHHPTTAGDDAVLAAARALADTSTVRFYDSLDSPLFTRFAGEQVQALWGALKLEEDEFISHPMVARAIRQAQGKTAKQARSTLDAASAEAWFRQNIP